MSSDGDIVSSTPPGLAAIALDTQTHQIRSRCVPRVSRWLELLGSRSPASLTDDGVGRRRDWALTTLIPMLTLTPLGGRPLA